MSVAKTIYKGWGWVSFCGDCNEPIPVDLCSQLGRNAGTDGHLCSSREQAEKVLGYFQDANHELFDDVVVAKIRIEVE